MRCPCEKGGRRAFCPPTSLPSRFLASLEWNTAAFWRGAPSCITHQDERGKQTGPDSSNRGSRSAARGALGVNQSWTAKLILIRGETDRIRGEEIVQALSFAMGTERVDRKKKKRQLGRSNTEPNGEKWWKYETILPLFPHELQFKVQEFIMQADGTYSFAYFWLSLNIPCHPVTLAYLLGCFFCCFFITSCRLWCGL